MVGNDRLTKVKEAEFTKSRLYGLDKSTYGFISDSFQMAQTLGFFCTNHLMQTEVSK
jgi:hypothetical protein